MTAPVFDPEKIFDLTYYVENMEMSTPEQRECFQESASWTVVGRPDGGPVQGAQNRRYWANVQAAPTDWEVDGRYNTRLEYDFVPYDPDPNAELPPDRFWPFGERRERVVSTLKSKDELKTLVLARQVEANKTLWPGDAIDQRQVLATLYRAKPVRSATEDAYLADFDTRAAGMAQNELVKNACFDAIESEEPFSLETGTAELQWVTESETP